LSTRRGYYYNPKFIFGKPSDQVNERVLAMRVPLWLQRLSYSLLLKATSGLPQDYGLPKPDHKFFETHPVVNQTLMLYVGQGDITHKPDLAELRGDMIAFKDGSCEAIDVLVYATGFNIRFPFIDARHLNWHGNKPNLYLNVFHPTYETLFVIGLIQPDSGQWGLADYQSQAMAHFLSAASTGKPGATALRKLRMTGTGIKNRGINYVDSTRHYVEVEHYSYREALKRLIRRLA
jgi:hypothetical protein